MSFRRASCQSHASLEAFYGMAAAGTDSSSEMGKAMLQLLPELEKVFAFQDAWGLTSHYHLWLLAADDYTSPWLVSVIALDSTHWHVGYRLPEVAQPWPDAIVTGEATSMSAAIEMIKIGMSRSGGW